MKSKDSFSINKNLLKLNMKKYLIYFIVGLIISSIPLFLGYSLSLLFNFLEGANKKLFIYTIAFMSFLTLLNSYLLFRNGINELAVRFSSSKIMRLSFISQVIDSSKLEANDNGKILNIIGNDILGIEYFLCNLIDLINKVVFFLGSFIILININLKITIYAIAPLIILNVLIFIIRNRYKEYFYQFRNTDIAHSNFVYEILDKTEIVQYLGDRDNFLSRSKKLSLVNYKSELKKILFDSFIQNGISFINNISIFIILLSSVKLIIKGEISPGEITLFINYIGYGFSYLNLFSVVISDYKRSEDSIERISRLISAKNKKEFIDLRILKSSKGESLKLNTLSLNNFQLNKQANKFNLNIRPNELVVVTGDTGSGKTQFINSLLGYSNYSGEIKINDKKVENLLQHNIGYCPQYINLFNMTLEENIELDKYKNKDIEKIKEISNISQDETFKINNIKDKIGINGDKLSEGQRQRLGIARAIYHSDKILILDDVFTFIDKNNRQIIMENLLKLNKIIIFASQDDNIMSRADKIVYMESNQIKAIG